MVEPIRMFHLCRDHATTMHKLLLLLLLLCSVALNSSGQRVGVVLSGGGAKAAAHLGVLRALEENHIPIDYIAGASMGAVIGGMYASGYTIAEIDSVLRSEEYQRMAVGEVDEELRYYFKESDPSAGMGTLKFSKGNLITPVLPTNLTNASLLDFNFMRGFAGPSAAANYDFNELMIPFRCVAADVENKEQVVFRGGHLSTALRASMTYPFYLQPIRVDGKLLFDGGLYNNFPSDILYNDFIPDVIIGSNVSSNEEPPNEDDPLSQIRSMVVYETNFESLCEDMIIINPEIAGVTTFEFDRINEAIDGGYATANAMMDSILAMVDDRVDPAALAAKRNAFRAKIHPLQSIGDITVTGLDNAERTYVRKFLGNRKQREGAIPLERIKRDYFRVYADDKIRSIYPTATFNQRTNAYRLNLDMKKEKDIFLTVGGNFSSRPLNMGYVNLRYNILGRASSTINANSYFGKFYGSVHLSSRFDFSASLPFSVEPFLTFNRWDYFRNFATFFEDVRPSYIVTNERFGGVRFRFPVNNKGRFDLIGNIAEINDDYYQTSSFLASDTADRTRMYAGIFDAIYDRNTLNHLQYPNSGTRLKIQLKYTNGEEQTIPGSTSFDRDTIRTKRDWLVLKAQYTNYFTKLGPFKVGMLMEGVLSNQPLFQNTAASLISAQRFQPIPESRTFYMPQFYAHSYAAGGLMLVTRFSTSLDLRVEGYGFIARDQIMTSVEGEVMRNSAVEPFYIGSAALVFHSPLGPLSLSTNYYDGKERPWSFLFNFGYLIFNRSVRHY